MSLIDCCYENVIDCVQAAADGSEAPIWGATAWQRILEYSERKAIVERESPLGKVGAREMSFPSALRSCSDGREPLVGFGIGRDPRLLAANRLACHRYDGSLGAH